MKLTALVLALLSCMYPSGAAKKHWIALKWIASTTPGVSYEVYRKPGGQTYFARYVATTMTSYLDTGVRPGQSYSYYVTAINSSGESAPSNTITLVVP
jgi:penicillin-binding protein 2A